MSLDCIAENATALMILVGFFAGNLIGFIIGALLSSAPSD